MMIFEMKMWLRSYGAGRIFYRLENLNGQFVLTGPFLNILLRSHVPLNGWASTCSYSLQFSFSYGIFKSTNCSTGQKFVRCMPCEGSLFFLKLLTELNVLSV